MRCQRCGTIFGVDEAYCGQCGAPNTHKNYQTKRLSYEQQSARYQANKPSSQIQQHPLPPYGQQPPRRNSSSQIPYPFDVPLPFVGPQPTNYVPRRAQQTDSIRISPPFSKDSNPFGPPLDSSSLQRMMIDNQFRSTSGPYKYRQDSKFPSLGRITEISPDPITRALHTRRQIQNAIVIIICICLGVALVTVLTATIFYRTTGNNQTHHQGATRTTQNTTATTSSSNSADAGFIWCTSLCQKEGASIEYPNGWQTTTLADNSIRFYNPTQTDQFIILRSLGQTTQTADKLLYNDIQQQYQTGSPSIGPITATTIGGTTWTATNFLYQGNKQREEVQIYATVYHNRAFIIEMQLPGTNATQQDVVTYTKILEKFQFTQ